MAEDEVTTVSPNLRGCDVDLQLRLPSDAAPVGWTPPARSGLDASQSILDAPDVQRIHTHESELSDAKFTLAATIAKLATESPRSVTDVDEQVDEEEEELESPTKETSHESSEDEAPEESKAEAAKAVLGQLDGGIAPNLLALLQNQSGGDAATNVAVPTEGLNTTWRPPARSGIDNSDRIF